VDASGHYTFTLNAPLAHPLQDNPATSGTTETSFEDNLKLAFTFTVTDGDGDQASSTLTINVDDDTPTATATVDAHVLDDENLVLGISGGPGDDGSGTVTTGTLSAQSGADGFSAFAFAQSVVVTDSNNNTVAQLQAVFVDANGVGHKENVSL